MSRIDRMMLFAAMTIGLMLGLSISTVAAQSEGVEDSPQSAMESVDDDQDSSCDRFIEAYVRSSARKLLRVLGGGDYALQSMGLGERIRVDVDESGRDNPLVFSVLREQRGQREVVGLVDRQRNWDYTYVIADSSVGPIVISQTWQPRHLRDSGQACRPFTSTIEKPSLTAATIDPEPFEFWGVRAGWRIPSPGDSESSTESVQEALGDVVRRHLEADDDEG